MRRSIWFWLLIGVLVVVLLGIIFGGYRKGTRVGALDDLHRSNSRLVALGPTPVLLPESMTGSRVGVGPLR